MQLFLPFLLNWNCLKQKEREAIQTSSINCTIFFIISQVFRQIKLFLFCCDKIATLGVNLAFKINCPNEVTRFQAAIVESIWDLNFRLSIQTKVIYWSPVFFHILIQTCQFKRAFSIFNHGIFNTSSEVVEKRLWWFCTYGSNKQAVLAVELVYKQ